MLTQDETTPLNFWQKPCHRMLAKITAHLTPPGSPSPSPFDVTLEELRGVVSDLETRGVETDAYWTCAYWHLRSEAGELGVPND